MADEQDIRRVKPRRLAALLDWAFGREDSPADEPSSPSKDGDDKDSDAGLNHENDQNEPL